MAYIVVKAVKTKIKESGKQISADALVALDKKVEALLEKIIKVQNGHKKRISATVVELAGL